MDHARMTELVEQLSEAMVRRTNTVANPDQSWLNNTTEEHQRVPFHAILARRNTAGHAGVLVADDLDDRTPLWTASRGVTISRTATAIAGAVGNIMRIATEITFIDPYFAPHHPRFRNVLEACLTACFRGRVGDPPQIRILSSDKNGADPTFFHSECRRHLPGVIPAELTVTVRRLKERADGERLHNRYILTEIGGVSFGVGLDEAQAPSSATDDLHVLDRSQYEERWRQYSEGSLTFVSEHPISIAGTRRSPDSRPPGSPRVGSPA
ncbi:MAG: hypothetical protein F4Y14_20625 [Acidobacteria bacterium]|nr:hypothetical protein [Acidobacteriota bacterium]